MPYALKPACWPVQRHPKPPRSIATRKSLITPTARYAHIKRNMMMTNVYDQQDAAFRHVSAYAILKDGKHIASVSLKHGAAVTAYVHYIGLEMTMGRAGGGGYDRASAAVHNAARKADDNDAHTHIQEGGARFISALLDRADSLRWDRALEAAGYVVAHVVD